MKIFAVGDICPTGKNRELFRNREAEALFGNTIDLIRSHDFAIANLECALTESDKEIDKFGPCLKAPTESAETIKKAGFDALSISNNHFFDFGKKGALDSLSAIEKAGLLSVGFGKDYEDARNNLLIEKENEKIVVISVCEREYSYALPDRMGSRPYDVFDTPEDIRRAKETADRVVVLYHGGKEHCRYPSPRLLRVCRNMAESGADLILCQHSHCIGCYEEWNGCHIVYGQGNFLFHYDGTMPDHWFESLIVSYDTVNGRIEFIPALHSERGVCLAEGEKRTELLVDFERRNLEIQNGEWERGWREFCLSVKDSYCGVITRTGAPEATDQDRHLFAHFLDCEAHHDVWSELFKTANLTNEK